MNQVNQGVRYLQACVLGEVWGEREVMIEWFQAGESVKVLGNAEAMLQQKVVFRP